MCISESLINNLISYTKLDNALNHSDHDPVVAVINMPSQTKFCSSVAAGSFISTGELNTTSNNKYLRWDRTNLENYYNMTRDLLYPIYESVLHVLAFNERLSRIQIEQYYSATVHAMLTASDHCVSFIPQKSLKHWWNSELSILKSNSYNSHKTWLDAGKPLNGFLMEQKTRISCSINWPLKEKRIKQKYCSRKYARGATLKTQYCFLEDMEK